MNLLKGILRHSWWNIYVSCIIEWIKDWINLCTIVVEWGKSGILVDVVRAEVVIVLFIIGY